MYTFRIHGARGSMPACGEAYIRYGGDTTCCSLETDEGVLVIDAGTGIVRLGEELARRPKPPPVTVLFTHLHMDHVMGLPFFLPFYDEEASIALVGSGGPEGKWRETLTTLVGEPYCPIDLRNPPASVVFSELPAPPAEMETCEYS